MCLSGKKFSILGDSISTFEGHSNNTDANTTIGNNKVYYGGEVGTGREYIKDVNGTWWKMLINETNMELVVNNSWSGSLVFDERIDACGYASRCFNLHNDHNNDQPEIILVYLGTNDAHQNINVGTYSKEEIDEFLTNEKMPSSFIEAYALMIHNIKRKYPNADIFCFSLLPFECLPKHRNEVFDTIIRQMVDHFKVNLIDLHNDCIIKPNMEYYSEGGCVHPNSKGMQSICDCVKSALLKYYNN